MNIILTKIMSKLLSMFLVFLSLFSSGQDSASQKQKLKQDEIRYLKEVQAFIRFIHKERLKDSTYLLINEPEIKQGSEKLVESDSTFSVEEKNNFFKQLQSQRIKSWEKIWPYKIKFISVNELVKSYKSINTFNWIAFKKNVSTSYYIISSPIFLRDYRYCVYYEANYSDSEEIGFAKLYKKVGINWILEKSVCLWYSSWTIN